ncbi:MAG: sugar phosphate isomerase/epimerase [Kiritimatiellae bacterium]|nr:sugar phosphate isomerase/epimerase [Kiritimatiellia bacterium]MDD5521849.1 sugar phosphate isomerase/epimerase [Kiritimatiellia bacterium]
MSNRFSRREFMKASSAGLALGLLGPSMINAAPTFKTKLQKALITGKPTEAVLKPMKEAGFEGVEAGIVKPAEAVECRKIAEQLGMRIHSVLRGWAEFNNSDKSKVESSAAMTIDALKAAQGYGADAVLLVPCRIGGMPMPEPWDFKIQFDDKTGHLTSVAEKDNDKYKAYIDAHNHAYDTSRVEIEKLIPVAEETKVVIAVENVWNNLFSDPRHLAHFVDSFKSPWVKIYFDLGNHVKYSPTEQWVRVLGNRIVKCHVKDFKLNADGHGGKFVDIRDGSVNWPVVRKALDEIGYNGWMTIEGSGGLSKQEQNKRLDMIIAGE